MTKIVPSIGRVVWYWRNAQEKADGLQPNAALVAYVHSESMVNLAVFDSNGIARPQTSVRLVQEGETDYPDYGFCTWMPYQIATAKKDTPATTSPAA